MTIHNTIIQHINTLNDPQFNLTIEQMGFKIELHLEANAASINLIAGFPVASLHTGLQALIQSSLSEAFPALNFIVTIESFIRAHRTQLPGMGLRGVKNTIAIASGKGGVGKSTVAVNLAVALARAGARVGILDADIYGPSIPMMLGDVEPVQEKDGNYLPVLAHGLQAMSIGYLTDSNQALIWRGPMLAKSLIQMLNLTLWNNLDYLFIDLPPGTGDIQLSLVQKIPLTTAVVVTTPQNIATLDAQKAIQMFAKTNIDVLGLVENMALHTCTQCGHEEAIFGEKGAENLSNLFSVPLLGRLPLASQIREQADAGNPIATSNELALSEPWLSIAMQTAITLAHKPINYADKFGPVAVE